MKRILKLVLGGVALLLLIQLVPYGRNHVNPPVGKEPAWDLPATRALAKRACFDCHSHETVWPWYGSFAPISWLVTYDVREGREHLNFSDWQNGSREGESPAEMTRQIDKGEMPPWQYTLAHPEARLSSVEKKQLRDGLSATGGTLKH